jgi:dihydrolipoamide dehydrogenase
MLTRITIVGSGPGGYVAAIRAAQRGARVTVVEEAEVGGTCLNWGCIPTKTLIASTDVLMMARHAADFGVELSGEVTYNLQKIRERRDRVVSTQVKGIRALFKSWGVDLIPGRGSLISEDVVRAVRKDGTTQDIRSDRIIIATGSRPAAIPGLPFDGHTILSSNDAVLMHDVPSSILIVGAGVIGCEFAFLYRSLGSSVTVVETLPRALSSEDEDISALIEKEIKKVKIKLITGARIENMKGTAEGVDAVLSNGQEVQAAKALVSIGRAMNTEGLRLEDAGLVAGKRGEIPVNDRMETAVPGIYAIGDVTGIMMLAHVASRQGIVAAENALGGSERMDYATVPAGIFTRPEIGSVGLREHQAREKGTKIRTGTFPYRALGKAHAMGEIAGIVKVIADAGTDRVLGVHICGARAADLVHEGALAITMGATAKQLGAMIHAHPTFTEGIMEAAEAVHGNAIHLPREGK